VWQETTLRTVAMYKACWNIMIIDIGILFALVEFLKYDATRRRMEKKENRIRCFGEDIQYAIVPLGCAR